VVHVIAEAIEDISPMLDLLLEQQGRSEDPAFAPPPEMS
jgi:DNA-directed RNA polymerase